MISFYIELLQKLQQLTNPQNHPITRNATP